MPLTPEQIARRTFTPSADGYHQGEVRAFLERVAAAQTALLASQQGNGEQLADLTVAITNHEQRLGFLERRLQTVLDELTRTAEELKSTQERASQQLAASRKINADQRSLIEQLVATPPTVAAAAVVDEPAPAAPAPQAAAPAPASTDVTEPTEIPLRRRVIESSAGIPPPRARVTTPSASPAGLTPDAPQPTGDVEQILDAEIVSSDPVEPELLSPSLSEVVTNPRELTTNTTTSEPSSATPIASSAAPPRPTTAVSAAAESRTASAHLPGSRSAGSRHASTSRPGTAAPPPQRTTTPLSGGRNASRALRPDTSAAPTPGSRPTPMPAATPSPPPTSAPEPVEAKPAMAMPAATPAPQPTPAARAASTAAAPPPAAAAPSTESLLASIDSDGSFTDNANDLLDGVLDDVMANLTEGNDPT